MKLRRVITSTFSGGAESGRKIKSKLVIDRPLNKVDVTLAVSKVTGLSVEVLNSVFEHMSTEITHNAMQGYTTIVPSLGMFKPEISCENHLPHEQRKLNRDSVKDIKLGFKANIEIKRFLQEAVRTAKLV